MSRMLTVAEVAARFERAAPTVMISIRDGSLHAYQDEKSRAWHVHLACAEAWSAGDKCSHMQGEPPTYAEKLERLRLEGIIFVSDIGTFFSRRLWDELAGEEVPVSKVEGVKMTAEQTERARQRVDEIAAEIGSRDLMDIAFHLFCKE